MGGGSPPTREIWDPQSYRTHRITLCLCVCLGLQIRQKHGGETLVQTISTFLNCVPHEPHFASRRTDLEQHTVAPLTCARAIAQALAQLDVPAPTADKSSSTHGCGWYSCPIKKGEPAAAPTVKRSTKLSTDRRRCLIRPPGPLQERPHPLS